MMLTTREASSRFPLIRFYNYKIDNNCHCLSRVRLYLRMSSQRDGYDGAGEGTAAAARPTKDLAITEKCK